MLPALGGGSNLRGFSSWRFRDRHSLLLQAEWRVIVNRFLDMAVFYDAGKVTARRGDLNLDGLKSDYGLGFRFHGPLSTPLRIEFAKSNEGLAIVFGVVRRLLRQPDVHTIRFASSGLLRQRSSVGAAGRSVRRRPRQAPRFYSDDPIAREPESRDASGAQPWDIGLMYELSYNLFVTSGLQAVEHAGREHQHDRRGARLELVHEPDRLDGDLRPPRSRAGPRLGPPPAPERWVILREKTAGANPGFTARDANGETWFLGFDPPSSPEGATAAVVIATKIFWALGYNQVETFLTTFDPDRAEIDPKATVRRPSGKRTPFTRDDMQRGARPGRAQRRRHLPRGGRPRCCRARSSAGSATPARGQTIPNDIVPHEHRRELRALRVFGAWTNLTDLKAGNTLDTLVTENGRTVVKHYLQDVGSTFGMANGPHEWDIGWEHFYEGGASRRRLLSFGFALSPWQTVPYTEYPSIGRFEGDVFDPTNVETADADDGLHGAASRRCVLGGAAGDGVQRRPHPRGGPHRATTAIRPPRDHLAAVLMKRRDTIGRTYLTAVNPVVNPRLDAAGALTFDNAAVAAGFAEPPTEYRAAWSRFDNATGAAQPIAETRSATTTMPAPRGLPAATGSFVANRHLRRQRRPSRVAAAGAHVLPPDRHRVEAGRPRASAGVHRRAGSQGSRSLKGACQEREPGGWLVTGN